MKNNAVKKQFGERDGSIIPLEFLVHVQNMIGIDTLSSLL